VSSSEYLFLYGTLMRGLGAMDALPASEHLRFVCESQVQGSLYDLGSYPGLKEGTGLVLGEVYEVLHPDVWEILDPYEDYFPGQETSSLYLRQSIELMGEPGYAWTYVYNQPVDEDRFIQDGDWRRYYMERKGEI
jgi:gamma-glutamylcyclotransferase (GGCT)/AIG2-like uncharacterized protein YtfP